MKRFGWFTLGLLAGALIMLVFAPPARAHEWYPPECCNKVHCEPLPAGSVTRTPQGWRMPNGFVLPYGAGRQTPDIASGFHWCRWLPHEAKEQQGGIWGNRALVRPHSQPVCIFTPPDQF